MVTILLLRHGQSTANVAQVLSGRAEGVTLTETGRSDIETLARTLPPLDVVRHSTIDRCVDTAGLVAQHAPRVAVTEPDARFDEVDYGEWTGKKLADLALLDLWKQIQSEPQSVRFPGGESMPEVYDRAARGYRDLVGALPEKGVGLIVSHGDIIKAIVAYAVGAGLGNFQRFELRPSHVCVLGVTNGKATLLLGGATSAMDLAGSLASAPTVGGATT